jgi:PhoPQ-activated pathogenicity-related protein
MVENQKDLETYVLKALASFQKMGKSPANVLIKTSPQNISIILRSREEPVRFGDWTAINITHRDFQLLTNMCKTILKDRGKLII